MNQFYTIICHDHILKTKEIVFDEFGRIPYLTQSKQQATAYWTHLTSWNEPTFYTYEVKELV